jgi:hypothetical protein
MNEERLVSALEKIRDIIDQALERPRRRLAERKAQPSKATNDASKASRLPDHIIRLRDSGFLKQPKTPAEVHAKLQATYPCDLNRVAVALLRLQKNKRALRKHSKIVGKRKLIAYVW